MNTTVAVDTRSFSCYRNVDEAEILVDLMILDFVTESAHYTYKDAQHDYDTATRSPYQFTSPPAATQCLYRPTMLFPVQH